MTHSQLLRKLATILSLCCVFSFVFGQGGQGSPSAEQRAAETAATEIRSLVDNLANQGNDSSSLLHYVFLVDTSHATDDTRSLHFTKLVIRCFLDGIRASEEANGASGDNRSLGSLFPYQLDLYAEPYALSKIPLTGENIGKLVDLLKETIPLRTNGEAYVAKGQKFGGHDNSQPRRDLMHQLGTNFNNRPTILIQITTNSVNEAPGRKVLEDQIKQYNSQGEFVAEAGFVANEEKVSEGIHFWIYEPKNFKDLPVEHVQKPVEQVHKDKPAKFVDPPRDKSGGTNWIVPVGIIAVLLVGSLWFLMAFPVIVNGTPYLLRRGQTLNIVCGPTKFTGKSYQLAGSSDIVGIIAKVSVPYHSNTALIVGSKAGIKVAGGARVTSYMVRSGGKEVQIGFVVGDAKRGERNIGSINVKVGSPKFG